MNEHEFKIPLLNLSEEEKRFIAENPSGKEYQAEDAIDTHFNLNPQKKESLQEKARALSDKIQKSFSHFKAKEQTISDHYSEALRQSRELDEECKMLYHEIAKLDYEIKSIANNKNVAELKDRLAIEKEKLEVKEKELEKVHDRMSELGNADEKIENDIEKIKPKFSKYN